MVGAPRIPRPQPPLHMGVKLSKTKWDGSVPLLREKRNGTLNRSAFKIGQLVASGKVEEDEAREKLADAARDVGLDEGETLRTLESGLGAGMATPREPDYSRFPIPSIESGTGKVSENGVIHLADFPKPGPRRFVVADLIPEGFMTSLYGDGGTGKSYLAMYAAFCV